MLKIVNNADVAEMYIYGDIVDDSEGNFITAIYGDTTGYQWPMAIKEQLDSIDENQPLTIYINSDGGSVSAGVAIANMIARHKGHTKAVVDGWAASIASQIFCSAKERVIPENAYLMIHKPATIAAGNADEFQKVINALDSMQAGLEATYNSIKLEGVSEEDIRQMVNNETWLTGAEAAKYFDVTVVPAVNAVAHAGKFFNKKKNGIPEGLNFKNDTAITEPKHNENEIKRIKARAKLVMLGGYLND